MRNGFALPRHRFHLCCRKGDKCDALVCGNTAQDSDPWFMSENKPTNGQLVKGCDCVNIMCL